MAVVRFISPFTKIVGVKQIKINAKNIGELCKQLIERFGSNMHILLDKEGEISKKVVILVNRRNVHTLAGIDTPLDEDTEVLIMPYIIGG